MTRKAEIKIWWRNLPGYIKGVATIISALGVIWACLTGMVSAISDNLNERIDAKVGIIAQKVENIELDTQRIQLLQLMQSSTATVKSVLDVAENYFCVLKGDSYVLYEFERWAKMHDVDATFVLKCHAKTYANM